MAEGLLIRSLLPLVMLAALFGSPGLLMAESTTVWRIGTFDEASREFSPGPGIDPATGRPRDYANAAHDLVYVVGKSEPTRDWIAFQPGTSNGKAGYRPHPFTIQFELPGTPHGVYSLKVALLAYSPRVPRLEVNINGHRGWFYQHPKLNYAAGDVGSVFAPRYSEANIAFDFPARFLNSGANKLVLTAIDEPGERDDSEGAVMVLGNSGITYDALELFHDPRGSYPSGQVTVEVVPTVFYKSQGDRLAEVVEVFVRFGERPRRGQVTLSLGKDKFTQLLQPDRDFGEQRVEFEVPEFTSATKGEVIVRLNGRARRFPQELAPGKKWNVFVVPHEHLDIGYSDYQAKVAEIQSRVIDEAMEMIREHPDFRFTIDGYWSVEQFLAGRSEEQRNEFLRLVREKKLFVPAQYASNLTGFPTVENLIRSLYHSHRFHRQHAGDFNHAFVTDVPSYSWSYASVLAAAGLNYFLHASNNWRGPFLILGRLHEKSPYWWEGPDGRRVLTWSSLSYHQVRIMFGLPPQAPAIRDSLPIFLQSYSQPEYRSDGVVVFGTQWENTDLHPQQTTFVKDWNKVYAYPQLRFAGFAEALEYIGRQFGDALPVRRGDGGPYWEDGIASDAFYAALGRENEQRALAAEKFSTISSFVNPRVRPDREALGQLWENMLLFDEHTWEADRSVSDPEHQQSVGQRAVKRSRATQGKRLLDHILLRSMAAIADFISNPSGTLVVFNPLNWARSSLVEVDLDKGLELVDLVTKQSVPYEVLSTGRGFRHVRFLASEVPAVGYKCYAMRPTPAEPPTPGTLAATTLESPYYRVVLHPESGSVESIFDKELNRELVDASSPYRFNEYIYVTGADEPANRLVDYSTVLPIPKLEPHGARGGRVVSVAKMPFGTVARLECSGVNTPRVETEIVLFDGQKKIQFTNRVHKTKVYTKEGIYFAFPFAMDRPQFRYATQNGFVDPAKDLLPGAGMEWFTVQHWVAAEQDGVTAALVPIDAPLVTLGDIVRGTWPTAFGHRRGTVFSYVMNNYWGTNYVGGQGGEFTFRYVLSSGRNLEPGALSRLGWEEMSPLEVNEIKYQDKAVMVPRPLDAGQSSFLEVDQPNVVLITWKLAEEGQGTILRFLEVGGRSGTVKVTTPLVRVESGWRCNAVEENQQPLSVGARGFSFAVKPYEIVTIRLQGTPALKSP